jgi:curved DNA-binding protein CbpA
MQESSYLILGLGENATLQEVENAYKTLKEKYQKQCFEEGETGSFAAKMLSKIRIAYNDCLDDIRKKEIIGEGSIYQAIEKLVGENKLNEAQALLDETEPRGGDWHFAQAHIFFKRNWFLDSKNQVEMALTYDPENARYKTTLSALNKMQSTVDDEAKAQRQARAGYSAPQETGGGMAGNGLCTYCASLLLCNAMCWFCF